jgi:hypothetical protein
MPSEQLPGSYRAGRRLWLRVRFPPVRPPRDLSAETPAEQRKFVVGPVQHAAATVAAVFGLVGLLGFLPGFTANLGALTFAGHHSGALLFGVFSVSALHNVIHLLFAVTGLALASAVRPARAFLFGGGSIHLLLALYGWLFPVDGPANVVPVNAADNWLHLALGAGMIALGFLPARSHRVREQHSG